MKHASPDKQREVDNFVGSYCMSLEQLLKLISLGIRQKNEVVEYVDGAFRGGNYLGCPGKDIYWGLRKLHLSGQDIDHLACALSKEFPVEPPVDHVAVAACLRYVYGCFDKQGSLLSRQHEIIASQNDWRLSLEFGRSLEAYFVGAGNRYGLIVLYEMEGHRLGDDAVVNSDASGLVEMLDRYNKAQQLAMIAGSNKHIFTPLYWSARYLEKFDVNLSKEYHRKSLEMMQQYCPDTREGYQSKAIDSARFMLSHSSKVERQQFRNWLNNCSNRCLRRIRKLI